MTKDLKGDKTIRALDPPVPEPQSGETPQLPIRPPRGEIKGETPIVSARPPRKR